jgi:protein O-mannosyl-transferase
MRVPAERGWPLGAVFALLFIATFIAYFPSLRGGYLWDDDGHVTSPALQSWSGLGRIWLEPGATQQYYPLLHSAFWLEHKIWGDTALGYRLVNILWHATSACLLVGLLRRLAVPGAWLAGLLFALHPVCVESVAWITEQKNTLSAVLYFSAALAWLRYEDDRRPARYAVATLFFIAALCAKTVVATLPAALLVVAWWRRGRLSWRADVLPLLPWIAAGVSAGLFTAWFERTGIGAKGSEFDLNLLERGLLAGRIFWFYLGKLIWPLDLAFFYPRWTIDDSVAWQYIFPVAALGMLGVSVWWVQRKGGPGRGILAAVLIFGGTLVPALGFVNVYPFVFSYVADHFQYLACPSTFALAAAGLTAAGQRGLLGLHTRGAQGLGLVIAVVLAGLTWHQSKDYTDSVTLYRATLETNPDSWVAHHNLGSELSARGEPAEALPHARRALELKPDYPETLNNLADNLTHTGRPAEALPLLERALQIQPRYAEAENNFGIALVTLGKTEEGMQHFQRALAIKPGLAEAHFNLGLAQAGRGTFDEAIKHFRETIRLRPDHVGAHLNLGVALTVTGRAAEADLHFERALQLDPEAAPLRQTYGRVLLSTGRLEAAAGEFGEALRLDPELPGVHRELATVLQRLGRTEEAQYHAAQASRRRE